jgi:hypothetical protein
MAAIAIGHAVAACSFIVPQKPHASLRVAGMVVLLMLSSVVIGDDGSNALPEPEAKLFLASGSIFLQATR